MKITEIKLGRISVPLRVPFKTALRTVESVEDIIVEVHTDTGNIGYGEAPPTGVITGDTTGAIIGAVTDHIGRSLIGKSIEEFEDLMITLNECVIGNTSAKAAVDIALWDLYGQLYNAPVYKLLGGRRKSITTDITISVNEPEEMANDSIEAVTRGYDTLKVKVGKEPGKDIERLTAIRKAIGYDVNIRVDANQGWKPKEAVHILRKMEDKGLNIEYVEQPVTAHDIEGLKYVRDSITIPVIADESVFSPADALRIMQMGAADLINIKLMKTGGIYNALKICSAAEIYGIECMIGCMLEAKVSVNAAVHLACGKSVITKVDLDGPALCSEDPISGGSVFDEKQIVVSQGAGFAIKRIKDITYIN
ncbi:MAG: dipeptide epimerase [Clostridiaceae bacterium]|nr:dipeptide epimerase [Clostridiaceae bacterium]